jgi:hypothetical protein
MERLATAPAASPCWPRSGEPSRGVAASGAGFKPKSERVHQSGVPKVTAFCVALPLDGEVSVEGKIAIDLGLPLGIFVAIYWRRK